MMANPYVRSRLSATRADVLRPEYLVHAWLNQVEVAEQGAEQFRGTAAATDAVAASHLLSACLKLRRTRPELLAQIGGLGLVQAVERQCSALRLQELAAPAVAQLAFADWWSQARFLEEHQEELEEEQLQKQAEWVLTELDDAELVGLTAVRLGLAPSEWQSLLDECRRWCLEHAELFLPAGVFVQTLAQTFRPDLLSFDPDLALTAVKYEAILDVLEEAEALIRLDQVPVLDRETAQALYRSFREQQPASVARPGRSYPRALLPPVVLLAAASPAEAPRLLWWQSPKTEERACLVLPAQVASEQQLVTLSFFNAAQELAQELGGQPVWLAGVPATIADDGRARFRLADLHAAGQDLLLEVGADRTPWKVASEPPPSTPSPNAGPAFTE
jgi:hypothetical protein